MSEMTTAATASVTDRLVADPERLDPTEEIARHAGDVAQFLAGELTPLIMKSRRVPRGIYEQRRNGTYMVRVRVPGGELLAMQAVALARAASRFGGCTLHVTTRQNLQFHGLAIDETPALLAELHESALSTLGGGGNTVRNITACPYAGFCPAERFDVLPTVKTLTLYLVALSGSYTLPRKYKIAVSGCAADCALAAATDLGLVAEVRDNVAGFRVYAGGGMGAESRAGDLMREWIPAQESIRMAEAVRRLFDRLGDRQNRQRARLRYAVARLGADAFRTLLDETLPVVAAEVVPDGTAGEIAPHPAAPPWDYRALPVLDDGMTVLAQRQPGRVAVVVGVPQGQIRAVELRALAELAQAHSAIRALRLTQDQKLLIPFVSRDALPELRRGVLKLFAGGLDQRHAGLPLVACTGAATCRLGLCLSQGAARACGDAILNAGVSPATLQAVDIRMNGCPNACGQHPLGTIGLAGMAQRAGDRLYPAYRIFLGARRGLGQVRFGRPVGTLPARALPAFLAALLLEFEQGRLPDERFDQYHERLGAEPFRALIARHAVVPSYEENPDFFRDWESDADFSLAKRRE